MPKFVIEREVPGAGSLTDAELRELSQKSVSVLKGVAPQLRNRRQSVLRLPRSGRSDHPGTRQAHRHPGQSRLRGAPTYRPVNRGVSRLNLPASSGCSLPL